MIKTKNKTIKLCLVGLMAALVFIGTSIKGARYEIIFDGDTQRTRVIIPAEHRDTLKPIVEKAGFYYAAAMDSWNKKLTFRAYRAAVALAAALDKAA